MATTPINRVIQHLRATCGRDGMTDGELLSRFLSGRDEDAIAALVRRHGPMVWGVCRRLLRSHHDAEDAFQATFLVLVQKAATLPDRETVGNWLYGVALPDGGEDAGPDRQAGRAGEAGGDPARTGHGGTVPLERSRPGP
jgi:Sigma-70 region 2